MSDSPSLRDQRDDDRMETADRVYQEALRAAKDVRDAAMMAAAAEYQMACAAADRAWLEATEGRRK